MIHLKALTFKDRPSPPLHPLRAFAYPTPQTLSPINDERIRNFDQLLSRAANDPILSAPDIMLREIRSTLQEFPDPQVRAVALRFLALFEELYPSFEKRLDGSPKQTHALSIAYWGLMGGAPADWICAALLHDTVEEGRIKDIADLRTRLALPDDAVSRHFISEVWFLVDGMTNREPQEHHADFSRLRKMLRSPADLADPEVMRILDLKWKSYEHYVLNEVYRSNSLPLINLKELDVLHNVKSLLNLDPKTNFYLYYSTLSKALIHIDMGKKVSHRLARATLESIGWALQKLEQAGYGPSQLPELFGGFHYHVHHRSPYQKRTERRGLAVTDPRKDFNPQTAAYTHSPVIEFYRRQEQDFLKPIDSDQDTPIWEFGVSSKVRAQIHMNFFDNTYSEVNYDLLWKRINRCLGPTYEVRQEASMQLPLLGDEFYIFKIYAPKPLLELHKTVLDGSADGGNTRKIFDQVYNSYSDYTEDLKKRLIKVGRGTVRRSYFLSLKDRALERWKQFKSKGEDRLGSGPSFMAY